MCIRKIFVIDWWCRLRVISCARGVGWGSESGPAVIPGMIVRLKKIGFGNQYKVQEGANQSEEKLVTILEML